MLETCGWPRRGRTLPITCKPSSKIGEPTPVGRVRPVLTVVPGAADADDPRRPEGVALIDEIVREGARRMLAEALRAEVDAYIAQFTGERDEHGRRLVVRNGTHQPREVRRTPAVLLGDPATLVPQDPEDHRSPPAALPARP